MRARKRRAEPPDYLESNIDILMKNIDILISNIDILIKLILFRLFILHKSLGLYGFAVILFPPKSFRVSGPRKTK